MKVHSAKFVWVCVWLCGYVCIWLYICEREREIVCVCVCVGGGGWECVCVCVCMCVCPSALTDLWEVRMRVLPLARTWDRMFHSCRLAPGSMPEEGSSSRITAGPPTSAMAVLSLRLLPPLSTETGMTWSAVTDTSATHTDMDDLINSHRHLCCPHRHGWPEQQSQTPLLPTQTWMTWSTVTDTSAAHTDMDDLINSHRHLCCPHRHGWPDQQSQTPPLPTQTWMTWSTVTDTSAAHTDMDDLNNSHRHLHCPHRHGRSDQQWQTWSNMDDLINSDRQTWSNMDTWSTWQADTSKTHDLIISDRQTWTDMKHMHDTIFVQDHILVWLLEGGFILKQRNTVGRVKGILEQAGFCTGFSTHVRKNTVQSK